jgi:hypothetical protein
MDECEQLHLDVACATLKKSTAIGHITAEAMDTSKATFLPSDLTKQSLEDLEAACGQFEPSLLPSLRRMVPGREQLKTQGYDNLVCAHIG